MNRFSRDEILQQALDMADTATLNIHDRPDKVIMPHAYSIRWLQQLLDMFHERYPFAIDVTKAPMVIQAGLEDVMVAGELRSLPEDFSIDVTDGLICSSSDTHFYRVRKIAFQEWLRIQTFYRSQRATQPRVLYYTIINNTIKIVPTLEEPRPAELWYYRLPPVLNAYDKPAGPSDWTLIEYVRLRALEWSHHPAVTPGAAKAYAERELAAERQTGLLQKSEFDKMTLSGFNYLDNAENYGPMGWMGGWPTAV
jgi:hypothetical protein